MSEASRPRATLAAPRTDAAGVRRSYVRFAALGDSVTHGIGDPQTDDCRGWARIMAGAMLQEHDVSLSNLATPGAAAADVRFFAGIARTPAQGSNRPMSSGPRPPRRCPGSRSAP